jgi:chromosome partitioning protein
MIIMVKKISVLNPKGGCGKSTISSNLGSSLLIEGYKTLLIDTDPQGTLRDWKSMDIEDIQPQIIIIDRPNLQKDGSSAFLMGKLSTLVINQQIVIA